jgi:hypothetical protein
MSHPRRIWCPSLEILHLEICRIHFLP